MTPFTTPIALNNLWFIVLVIAKIWLFGFKVSEKVFGFVGERLFLFIRLGLEVENVI